MPDTRPHPTVYVFYHRARVTNGRATPRTSATMPAQGARQDITNFGLPHCPRQEIIEAQRESGLGMPQPVNANMRLMSDHVEDPSSAGTTTTPKVAKTPAQFVMRIHLSVHKS